ncbi:MAG: glycosyl transferase family 28 [Gemmatimonadaceae bacterium]|nr:glycosyl transferase family 28 [Chitinophagaceae bacterium]
MPEKPNFNANHHSSPIVLIAPLDWGLGHASRCIPVIQECLNAGFEVIIAASGHQLDFLRGEFPNILCVKPPSYNVKYATKGWKLWLSILKQVPKILTSINKENKWLLNFSKYKHLDLIISDSRFGFSHPNIHSVFIGHQMAIRTGLGPLADKIIRRINYHYINQFTECWIPDTAEKPGLAGELSHPQERPTVPVHYIGHLSRIKQQTAPVNTDLVIILSGPEPQRSIFEAIIIKQLKTWKGTAVMVRGLPGDSEIIMPANEGIKILNHAGTAEMQTLIDGAAVILCRSGYSSIMDLIPINKKCIMVPTPGQTEQVYLAAHLKNAGLCTVVLQEGFDLSDAVRQARAHVSPAFVHSRGDSSVRERLASFRPSAASGEIPSRCR